MNSLGALERLLGGWNRRKFNAPLGLKRYRSAASTGVGVGGEGESRSRRGEGRREALKTVTHDAVGLFLLIEVCV